MTTNTISITVKKSKLAENGDYNLTADRYRETVDYSNAKWPMVELGEILEYEQPTNYLVESTNYKDEYKIPVLTAGKSFLLGYTNEENGIFSAENLPVIIFDDFTTATKFVNFPFKVKSSAMKILKAKENVNIRYVFYMMQKLNFDASQHKRYWISQYSKIQIPLPPLAVQEQIVAEIEQYQKVIDGAKQVVQNWKPSFRIDPSWEMVELGEVCEILDNLRKPITKSDRTSGEYPYYGATGILDYVQDYIFDEKLVLIGEDGAKWDKGDKTAFIATGKCWVNNHAHVLRPDRTKLLDELLVELINSMNLSKYITGITVPKLNQGALRSIKIPLPPLAIQEQIVAEIEAEQRVVSANKELMEKMQKKVEAKIGEVWGEEI